MIPLKGWCWVSGALALTSLMFVLFALVFGQEKTEKPVLHGKHWIAITGKPMAATARAIRDKYGNLHSGTSNYEDVSRRLC
jgi:hypothetical protein